MADILRQPLVSHPQRKRPIAPVDYFSRPLTLGINPNARIAPLSDSAPQRTRRVHIDVYPNLLGTTLGAPAALELPLRAGRLFDSATGKRWQADPLQSQGLIVYDGPEAAVAQLSDSAPRPRRSLSVEQASNLLTSTLGQSGLAPPLLAIRLDASAPRRAAWLSIDAQGSRVVLGDITMPLMSERADASTPARIAQVVAEQLGRPLTLGINPNAAVVQLSDSAPPPKRVAYPFDPPNLLGSTLQSAQAQLSLPLSALRMDGSAPAVKYQVRIEALSRPLTLGINPNAEVASITESAPPPKRAAYAFDPPNLIASTLAEPLELPRLAVRIDWSAPGPKMAAYLDLPANTLLVAPPPSVAPRAERIVVVSAVQRRVTVH